MRLELGEHFLSSFLPIDVGLSGEYLEALSIAVLLYAPPAASPGGWVPFLMTTCRHESARLGVFPGCGLSAIGS